MALSRRTQTSSTKLSGQTSQKAQAPILEELTSDQEASGVEVETKQEADATIKEPFDPEKIDVKTKPMVVDLMMARIRGGSSEIDLLPDFQRRAGIWDQKRKSRLIESLLLRIPLPVFYVAEKEDECWAVVDGLQRIKTLKEFILDDELELMGMEFLTDLNGKKFSQLSRPMQRRINETEITVHIIQPGTPAAVMFNIFKRINTGGLPLSGQEIRHAIKQGNATNLLKRLAESKNFQVATGNSIRDERMADRECALRFCAFYISPPENYASGDLDKFLIDTMDIINGWTEEEIKSLEARFGIAMRAAHQIFESLAFRKQSNDSRLSPINKALFEAWSVNLAQLSNGEIKKLISNRDLLCELFKKLLRRQNFVESISTGTGAVNKVQTRFKSIRKIIQDVLDV